jgi:signal transduction histidine kinase
MAIRLRTRLVIASLVMIGALTASSLFIVQRTVRSQVQKEVGESLLASENLLRTVQADREEQLSHTAALLSELPTLKALMATQDRSTVQDGSEAFWKLSGGDAFLLASSDGRLLAKHFAKDDWADDVTVERLRNSVNGGERSSWWFDHGRLYWFFFHQLRAGAMQEARDLGVIAIGYEVNKGLAARLASTSRSEIAIIAGQDVIASTIPISSHTQLRPADPDSAREDVSRIGDKPYSIGAVHLQKQDPPVICMVLVPLGASQAYLDRINRTIFIIALATVIIGGIVFSVIARAMTQPLENVIQGIQALSAGDYEYNINAKGSAEVEQLASAFSAMRPKLLESQRNQLAAERISALGHTASSISHDLRHYLAAVVANAEFLYEADQLKLDRDEIYREIKTATEQMVDLIDSLRELTREQSSLQPVNSDIASCVRRAIDAVNARQDFHNCEIVLRSHGDTKGVFDPHKIERVFFNLVLNSCEALGSGGGHVNISVSGENSGFVVRVADDGPGIPGSVRETLFDPFVSSGKNNGTGLGLAIAKKILHDHGGYIAVESTSERGTTMLIKMPREYSPAVINPPMTVHGNL